MPPITVTIGSQKGGVGKTTTAVNLAHGLAVRGKTVVLVDLDPQGQSAVALGLSPEPGVFNALVSEATLNQVIRGSGRRNLWVVPGEKRTATAQVVLAAESRDMLRVARETFVAPFNGTPDYVLFDTAPSVGGLQESALCAARLVIIPAALDYLALFGVTGVLDTLKMLSSRHNWHGQIAILPTFYDEVTTQSRENLDKLRADLGAAGLTVLDPIHRATALRECAAAGKTIFEQDPKGRAAAEYAALVWKTLKLTRK